MFARAKSVAERYGELSRNDPAFRGASLVLVGLAALFVVGPAIGHFWTAVQYYIPIPQGCSEIYTYLYIPGVGEVRSDTGVCVPNIVFELEIAFILWPITGIAGLIIGW